MPFSSMDTCAGGTEILKSWAVPAPANFAAGMVAVRHTQVGVGVSRRPPQYSRNTTKLDSTRHKMQEAHAWGAMTDSRRYASPTLAGTGLGCRSA